MASFNVFTISCPASPGSATHPHGLGVAPKALIAFGCNLTSEDASGADYNFMVGFGDGSGAMYGSGSFGNHGADPTETYRHQHISSANRFVIVSGDATVIAEASLTSVDATNITLNWGTVVSGLKIFCLAIGGSDVKAEAGQFTETAGTTPYTQDVTLSDSTLTPDIVFFTGANMAAGADAASDASIGIGVSDTINEGCAYNHLDDGRPNGNFDRATYQTTRAFASNFVTSVAYEFQLTSVAAGQFTITYQDQSAGTTLATGYLAIEGLDVAINNAYDQPSAQGNDDIALTGITPECVLVFSRCQPGVGEAEQVGPMLAIGAGTSSTNRSCAWSGDDRSDPANLSQNHDNAALIKLMSPSGATPTVDAEADLVSFAADKATVNWTTADATARRMCVVGFATAAAGPVLLSVAGTSASSGALTLQVQRALGGSTTPTGALARQVAQFPAGSMASVGDLTRQPARILSGTTANSGGVSRQAEKLLSGTTTSAGSLVRSVSKTVTGVAASVGALIRQAQKPLAGTLTSSGVVTEVKVVLLGLSGTTSSSGALIRRISKSLSGTAASAGSVARRAALNLAGVAGSAGTLLKLLSRSLAGSTTSSGTVAVLKSKLLSLAGSTASVGVLAKSAAISLTGSSTSSGTVATLKSKLLSLAGSLTSSGGVIRQAQIVRSGISASSGSLVRQVSKSLAGAAASAGSLVKSAARSLAGTLVSAGILVLVKLGVVQIDYTDLSLEAGSDVSLSLEGSSDESLSLEVSGDQSLDLEI